MVIAHLTNYDYKISVVEQKSSNSEYKAGIDIHMQEIINKVMP